MNSIVKNRLIMIIENFVDRFTRLTVPSLMSTCSGTIHQVAQSCHSTQTVTHSLDLHKRRYM